MSVFPAPEITVAPLGIGVEARGPTACILPSLTTITPSRIGSPPAPSQMFAPSITKLGAYDEAAGRAVSSVSLQATDRTEKTTQTVSGRYKHAFLFIGRITIQLLRRRASSRIS